MSDPNQTDPTTNQTPVASPPVASDQPLVPDFQTTDSTAVPPMIPDMPTVESNIPSTDNAPDQTPNATPSDVPPTTSSAPKKTFGAGRIVATILGFLVLVGGIAGGVILTQQQQDIREKAEGQTTPIRYRPGQACSGPDSCGPSLSCINSACVDTQTDSNNCGAVGNKCTDGKTCISGACTTSSSSIGQACSGPNQCQSPLICVNQKCEAYNGSCRTCTSDKKCADTDVVGCTNDNNCANDAACASSTTSNDCKSKPNQVCISSSSFCTAPGCTAGSGTCSDSLNPFCAKISSSTGAPLCRADQDCNIPSSTSGAQQCNLPGTSTNTYCCPSGKYFQDGKCINAGTGGNNCSQVKCTATGCTTGSAYSPTGGATECTVFKYRCPSNWPAGVGCQETLVSAGQGGSFSGCGTEQIDINCPACGIKSGSAGNFVSRFNQGNCSNNNETPPPGGPTANCQDVRAYSTTFTALTPTELSQLKPTNQVNFCVRGISSAGSFDKAKFTINSVAQAETTTKRPSTNDFCQLYTIPAGTTAFEVNAQVHHATLGWK